MTDRAENRKWLEDGASRDPDGWEARMIARWGIEGTLDVLAAQVGDVYEINLTHRPFAGDDELKAAVRVAREALSVLAAEVYELWWNPEP